MVPFVFSGSVAPCVRASDAQLTGLDQQPGAIASAGSSIAPTLWSCSLAMATVASKSGDFLPVASCSLADQICQAEVSWQMATSFSAFAAL